MMYSDVHFNSTIHFNVNGNVAVYREQCLVLSWLNNVNAFALTLDTDHLCRHTHTHMPHLVKIDESTREREKTCLLLSTQS